MSLGAPLGTTEVIFCGQKRSICLTAKKERQSVLQFEFIRWSRYGKYGYNIWIVGKDMEYMDRYGRSGAGVQTLRVGLSASEILISKFIGFQRTSSHGETSNIHAGKLCFDYMTIWTDICNDSFPSTIQYWRLIETHKPSCNQAYSSKTKLSSPFLVRPPFELGSWKAERRKTLPFSSKLCLLAQIAWLWPLWGVLEAFLFVQILIY